MHALFNHLGIDTLSRGSVALPVVAGCADVSRLVMIDATELVGVVFSGLSALVIEDIKDAGEMIVGVARDCDSNGQGLG